jgi:hypothetical protein
MNPAIRRLAQEMVEGDAHEGGTLSDNSDNRDNFEPADDAHDGGNPSDNRDNRDNSDSEPEVDAF